MTTITKNKRRRCPWCRLMCMTTTDGKLYGHYPLKAAWPGASIADLVRGCPGSGTPLGALPGSRPKDVGQPPDQRHYRERP